MSYLTEEEAKSKWCPHARTVLTTKEHGGWEPVATSYNRAVLRGDDEITTTMCIGSECMMWKEESLPHAVHATIQWDPHNPPDGWEVEHPIDEASGGLNVYRKAPVSLRGKCGLVS